MLALSGGCAVGPAEPHTPALQTIAFASCIKKDQPQAIWQSILASEPDLFLLIGDNVYVDVPRPPDDADDFRAAYQTLADQPGWRVLREQVPVLATWDDHDYGLNDAGTEYPLKHIAQQQFIAFFDPPVDSPIRQRPGVYDAHVFGPPGQRVQVILLDTRTFRDQLARNPRGRVNGLGPYAPRSDGRGSMLGEAQWAWLDKQLRKPAELRLIASSIQVVADEHGWETWGNLPHERDRLYRLIGQTGADGVFFISGDRHLTEASVDDDPAAPYPLWDFTSSGTNERARPVSEPNRHRRGPVLRQANFGVIEIDWSGDAPRLTFRSKDASGTDLIVRAVELSQLSRAVQP